MGSRATEAVIAKARRSDAAGSLGPSALPVVFVRNASAEHCAWQSDREGNKELDGAAAGAAGTAGAEIFRARLHGGCEEAGESVPGRERLARRPHPPRLQGRWPLPPGESAHALRPLPPGDSSLSHLFATPCQHVTHRQVTPPVQNRKAHLSSLSLLSVTLWPCVKG
jgi:hypothetical protein